MAVDGFFLRVDVVFQVEFVFVSSFSSSSSSTYESGPKDAMVILKDIGTTWL